MNKLHYGMIGIFLLLIALTATLWWSPKAMPINPVVTPAAEPATTLPVVATTSSPVVVPSTELDITPVKPCVISGCSGQICGESQMMSSCEYREIYQCYKSARCERNTQGVCGWVEDDTLRSCLNTYQ